MSDFKKDGEIPVRVAPEIGKLVPRFLRARRDDVVTIEAAIVSGDFDTIRQIGHNMRGVGAAYGFQGLSTIGRSLEAAAPDGKPEELRELLGELVSYLERLRVEYD